MPPRRPSAQTLLVLAALAERPDAWRHGYELLGETGLASGTLYPILVRLADRGWLDTRWAEGDAPGPRRHLYRLTGAGQAAARESRPAAAPAVEGPAMGGPAVRPA